MDPSQPGTSPHELFEHFMADLREKHRVIKGLIKHHFKKVGFKMTEETTALDFRSRAEAVPEYTQLREYLQ
jgi:hypothetical protein